MGWAMWPRSGPLGSRPAPPSHRSSPEAGPAAHVTACDGFLVANSSGAGDHQQGRNGQPLGPASRMQCRPHPAGAPGEHCCGGAGAQWDGRAPWEKPTPALPLAAPESLVTPV